MAGIRFSVGRWAATGAMMAIAVGSVACGDGEDKLSADEFATRVNALCEAEHEQVDALFADFPEQPTPEDMQQLVADFAPIIRQYRDDVVAVGEPSGKERQVGRYVDLLDEAVERYEAASDDPAKAEALFNEDDTRMAEAEQELGLDVCASR